MRKIQVITQKELIRPPDLKGNIAVVIDVFLATSTIAYLLKNNYEPVYAKASTDDAAEFSQQLKRDFIMLGESKGNRVDGFMYPDPTLIEKTEQTKAAIITSTNGTIAIERAKQAKKLYISSLVNGHVVARELIADMSDASIIFVCSGNDNDFSLEDFVGAGQVIHYLIETGSYALSDSARAAVATFLTAKKQNFQNLSVARTANLLRNKQFPHTIDFVLEHYEKIDVLPVYESGKIVNRYRAYVE